MKSTFVLVFVLLSAAVFGQGHNTVYQSGTVGTETVAFGFLAGNVATGWSNSFIGIGSGVLTTTGNNNVMVGYATGAYNASGSQNTFLGSASGYKSIASNNVFVGSGSGYGVISGGQNTFLGAESGHNNVVGTGNIFLGYSAGANEPGSNKLYIHNSNTPYPLIYGDFSTPKLTINGELKSTGLVTIGTTNKKPEGYMLAVDGKAIVEELVVELEGQWPDYVFEEGYKLPSLAETEKYIREHKHLPGVPTAEEVKANGLNLGESNAILLKKVEELTLLLIAQQKTIEDQQKIVERQQKQIDLLMEKVK